MNLTATKEQRAKECDCGWELPAHLGLNLGYHKQRDEDAPALPEDTTVSVQCPCCGRKWHQKMRLLAAEQTVTE